MEPKTYTINGRAYVQRPIVIGQAGQLKALLQGVDVHGLDPLAIIESLGEKLPRALAIVLTPEGERVSGKDLAALATEFEEHLDIDTALEVAADFLSFNPLSSIFRRYSDLIGTVWGMAKAGPDQKKTENPTG